MSDAVEKRLLRFLQILVVRQRQAFHRDHQRGRISQNRARSCRAPTRASLDSSSAASRCCRWSKLPAEPEIHTPAKKTESSPPPTGSNAWPAATARSRTRSQNRGRWWRRCCSPSAHRIQDRSAIKARSSGQRRARDRARSQRTNIQPLAAIRKPVRIAQKHLDISQQPVSHQHRLRPLQMRVRRHRRIRSLLRAIGDHSAQFGQFVPQLIDRRPHVQPQVGRDLLVAAAAAVQLVSRLPDQRDELLLDEVMNVLRFIVLKKRTATPPPARRSAPAPAEC